MPEVELDIPVAGLGQQRKRPIEIGVTETLGRERCASETNHAPDYAALLAADNAEGRRELAVATMRSPFAILDSQSIVSQMSDMLEVTTRDFTRNFADYRSRAAAGEVVRIATRDGHFLFQKENAAIRCGDFLRRVGTRTPGGYFTESGGKAIDEARSSAQPARSPWT